MAVKTLSGSGALHSFVCGSILPFSSDTNTGDLIFMWGMSMMAIPVPVHKMELVCGLVTGEVVVGVRPALPVEGDDIILGNDLAGDRVWADVPPPFVVTQVPVLLPPRSEGGKTAKFEPEVELFAASQYLERGKDEAAQQERAEAKFIVIPEPLKSISQNQTISPAPLCPIPALDQPFEYLIMDCECPLPPSKSNSEYLLTVRCQATCYPAAYLLRSSTAKSVVKVLSRLISLVGIPKVKQLFVIFWGGR